MATTVTDVQGTKAYLVDTTVNTTTATDIATAISGGDALSCFLEFGDIDMGSRAVTSYSCIDSDSAFKSLGSITLATVTPEFVFDVTDPSQIALKSMFINNTRKKMIVELDDQITPTTGNPTYYVFETGISNPVVGLPKDGIVLYRPVMEITSKPIETVAT